MLQVLGKPTACAAAGYFDNNTTLQPPPDDNFQTLMLFPNIVWLRNHFQLTVFQREDMT